MNILNLKIQSRQIIPAVVNVKQYSNNSYVLNYTLDSDTYETVDLTQLDAYAITSINGLIDETRLTKSTDAQGHMVLTWNVMSFSTVEIGHVEYQIVFKDSSGVVWYSLKAMMIVSETIDADDHIVANYPSLLRQWEDWMAGVQSEVYQYLKDYTSGVFKQVFTADSGWVAGGIGYKLTLDATNRNLLHVWRENADGSFEQVVTGIAYANDQIIIEALTPFKGFIMISTLNDHTVTAEVQEMYDRTIQAFEDVREWNNKVYVGTTEPTMDNVKVWINPDEDDPDLQAIEYAVERAEQVAQLIDGNVPYVTPEMFGAVGDGVTNDTNAINSAINSTVPLILFSNKTYVYNGGVFENKKVTIDLQKATLKINGALQFDNSKITFLGGTFDGNSSNFQWNILRLNNCEAHISKTKFENFVDTTLAGERWVIGLRFGGKYWLDNVSFNNIVCVGDGTPNSSQGALRCVLVRGDELESDIKHRTDISISNIYAENVYNIDSKGNIILDDADIFVFQGDSETNIVINNIITKNAGKRLLKVQGANCSGGINNAIVSNDTTFPVAECVYLNNCHNFNVSNISVKGGMPTSKIFSFVNTKNINLENITIDVSKKVGSDGKGYNACVHISSSSNINVDGVSAIGNSTGLTIWQGEKINVSNCCFETKDGTLFIANRTEASATAQGTCDDISINNVYFTSEATTVSCGVVQVSNVATTNISLNACKFVTETTHSRNVLLDCYVKLKSCIFNGNIATWKEMFIKDSEFEALRVQGATVIVDSKINTLTIGSANATTKCRYCEIGQITKGSASYPDPTVITY